MLVRLLQRHSNCQRAWLAAFGTRALVTCDGGASNHWNLPATSPLRKRFLSSSSNLPSEHNQSALELQLERAMVDEEEDEIPLKGTIVDIKRSLAFVSGLREAKVGSIASFTTRNGSSMEGIVLHLEKEIVIIALLGNASDLELGATVEPEGTQFHVSVGKEVVGRILDPLGNALDGKEKLDKSKMKQVACLTEPVPGLINRRPIQEPLHTGIQTLDSFFPLGHGHRFAILGERGSGKTRLVLEMLKNIHENVQHEPVHCVYVAMGKNRQRSGQIISFLEDADLMDRTTVITSNEIDPLTLQYIAPFVGCSIAEHFRNEGKKCVIVYDDLSTHQYVLETLGENYRKKGRSPLSLAKHTNLLERAGNFSSAFGGGSITAFCLADASKSLTAEHEDSYSGFASSLISMVDSHISVDPSLSIRRKFPPIDISIPRYAIRGPPFMSKMHWILMSSLNNMLLEGYRASNHAKMTKELGLDPETEVTDKVTSQALIQDFFFQDTARKRSESEILLGCFVLCDQMLLMYPRILSSRPALFGAPSNVSDIVQRLSSHIELEYGDVFDEIKHLPKDKEWGKELKNSISRITHEFLSTESKNTRR